MALETVLIVDEDRAALEAKCTLVRFSFHVLTADSGWQALKILKSKTPVDLVLSAAGISEDMPGMSLVDRIRVVYPQTPVLLMAPPQYQPIDASIPLLIKPFSESALIDRVHQVLTDARRASELLLKTFETTYLSMDELAMARISVAETVRQSRQQRIERFCARVRAGVAVPTIIVADDDVPFRNTLCRFLKLEGFGILEASDGQEALKIMREHTGNIDVLVTDFQMPGMNGVELAQTLVAESPRTRIIFMTGNERRLPGRTLRKPFPVDELLSEIVDALVAR